MVPLAVEFDSVEARTGRREKDPLTVQIVKSEPGPRRPELSQGLGTEDRFKIH